MRKAVLLALAVSAVMVASLVASADARTETQFSVGSRIEKVHVHASTRKTLVFLHGTLSAHHRRVGSETVKATARHTQRRIRIRLRWVARVRGQGSIKAIGTLFNSRRFVFNAATLRRLATTPHRLVIIGGTGAFNGAAGKLFFRDVGGRRQRLDFHFVQ
jgi:hypothetical protein